MIIYLTPFVNISLFTRLYAGLDHAESVLELKHTHIHTHKTKQNNIHATI